MQIGTAMPIPADNVSSIMAMDPIMTKYWTTTNHIDIWNIIITILIYIMIFFNISLYGCMSEGYCHPIFAFSVPDHIESHIEIFAFNWGQGVSSIE